MTGNKLKEEDIIILKTGNFRPQKTRFLTRVGGINYSNKRCNYLVDKAWLNNVTGWASSRTGGLWCQSICNKGPWVTSTMCCVNDCNYYVIVEVTQ